MINVIAKVIGLYIVTNFIAFETWAFSIDIKEFHIPLYKESYNDEVTNHVYFTFKPAHSDEQKYFLFTYKISY